jgi:hypothetical protein
MPDLVRAGAVLLSVSLLAGCGSGPVSQATSEAAIPDPVAGSPAVSPAPTPASTPSPTSIQTIKPSGPPPKPGSPTYALKKETPTANGTTIQEYEITWTSPQGVASAFLVYGVTDCLRYKKKYDSKPCIVRGMPIPKKTQVLLGEVPGDARATTVSWEIGEIGPGPYQAILIRASNAAGDSIFTIVHSATVCFKCVY